MHILKPIVIYCISGLIFANSTGYAKENNNTPIQTVKSFLLWLQKSKEKAYDYHCWSDIPGKDGGYTTSGVNEKCLDGYIKNLQSTGLFTKAYTDSLNWVFQKRVKEVKSTGETETDDVVRFFENQDPPKISDLLKAIEKKTVVTTYLTNKHEKALVSVYPGPPYNKNPYDRSSYSMDFLLKIENDKWKISCFECMEPIQ